MLTHRIAYLIATGAAQPNEILAITFTNKAAGEMRDRAGLLVGRRVRAMWVMTFHAACARMLRAEAPRLGYTRQFSIYDSADSRRLVKRCLDEHGIDPKRFTPASIQAQISDAKNKLRDADAYAQMVGSFFEQTVADVYRSYERELHRMNAMDFDDLLVRAVNVLELFPEVRERYANGFRHVLVDEYQDTNHVQYRWLQLLAGEHRNLMVVGDDAQCLVEGTLVTMADGSERPIEQIRAGDEVLSGYGSGDFRAAKVLGVHRSSAAMASRSRRSSGGASVSTPEHVHFAGYLLGRDPTAVHDVPDVATRRGLPDRDVAHVHQRCRSSQSSGSRCEPEESAPMPPGSSQPTRPRLTHAIAEAFLSAKYGLPTVPFRRRAVLPGSSRQPRRRSIPPARRLFAELDTRGRRVSGCWPTPVCPSTARTSRPAPTPRPRCAGDAWRSRSAAIGAAAPRCTGSPCSGMTRRAGVRSSALDSVCARLGAGRMAGGSRRRCKDMGTIQRRCRRDRGDTRQRCDPAVGASRFNP